MSRNPRPRAIDPRSALPLLIALLLVLSCRQAGADPVDAVAGVKTLFVEPFRGGADAAAIRDRLTRDLAGSRFRLVQTQKEADAVLKGTAQIWVHGFITTNARTPANNRQAVFSGYLSLEIVNSNNQPLWSWLITPGRLAWKSTVDDLASRGAKKLLEAAGLAASSPAPAGPGEPLTQATVSGAGATFPAPLYQKWFEDFEQLHPTVHLRYSPIGSLLGNQRLVAGDIDFAGSDVIPEEVVGASDAAHLRRFATVLGAVVPIYNLNGAQHDLRFTAGLLADIYLGRVKRWNDPEIRRFNRGVDLPDAEISVVHRSDGSGTTWVWSDYLSKVSPAWSSSVGRGTRLHWPVGIEADGNDGVARAVKQTPNSIGYVELTYAIQNQLSFGSVQNRAGQFVRADLDSLTEATRQIANATDPPPAITDAPGKYSYPIVSFTWLVVPSHWTDPAKQAAFFELLRWILTSGQKDCSSLGYAPLPREIAAGELRSLPAAP